MEVNNGIQKETIEETEGDEFMETKTTERETVKFMKGG